MCDKVLGFLKSTADTTALVTQSSDGCTSPWVGMGRRAVEGGRGVVGTVPFHTSAMGMEVYPGEFLGTAVQKGGGLSFKGEPLGQSLGTLSWQIFSLLGLWRGVKLGGHYKPQL